MRTLVNIVAVLLVAATALGLSVWAGVQAREELCLKQTRDSLTRLESEVRRRASLGGIELSATGYPMTIKPEWFEEDVPRHMLLDEARPWVEIAPSDEATLDHPPVRVDVIGGLAAFWYNPAKGVVRARVPASVSDRATLEMYNKINGSELETLFTLPPAHGVRREEVAEAFDRAVHDRER
jgi:hypothetical protein